MKTLEITSYTEADTRDLAKCIANAATTSAFIALYGGLGAGKTAFTRAFAEELGINDILSPTFTIVREHMTHDNRPLFHFDAYRLTSVDELFAMGFDDYISRAANKKGIIVMEWCENVQEALPDERLDIVISGSGDMPRNITLTAHGNMMQTLLHGIL